MQRAGRHLLTTLALVALAIGGYTTADSHDEDGNADASPGVLDRQIDRHVQRTLAEGRRIFRFDTFGNEVFWGDTLRLHEAIARGANGGVGPGVSPATALAVGLKVDVEALPRELREALRQGRVDLASPTSTLVLLKLGAVVGVRGFFDDTGQRLRSIGITCALCHSEVDDSFGPGIGHRRDGRAARDLNVGAIIALAPNLQPLVDLLGLVHPATDAAAVRAVLRRWGPGKFDAALLLDGKAFRPDGRTAATLIPPAFGLAGVNLHTWTGWGSVTHWNALVANLEMQGRGTFYDPRLQDPVKFPIAALAGFADVRHDPDLVTSKLAPLHLYQLGLPAPRAYTEPGWNLRRPEEIGIDSFQADRSPDGRYRTAPLKGLWTHAKGGFYHDGRFATLRDVVDHYERHFDLGLSARERQDLIEFLKSI